MDSYGQKLRDLRQGKNITQDKAAQALGITRPTYIAIETNKRDITINELHILCSLYETTIQKFLFSSTQSVPYENRMTKFKQLILNCLQYGSGSNDLRTSKNKLAGLVFMADFAAYYESKLSFSELPYRRAEYGPIVDAYYRMIDELYDEGAVTVELRGRSIVVHANEPSAPHSLLSAGEVDLIKRVCEPWQDKATQEVIEFIKEQRPWKECTQGEIIPYNVILKETANPFTDVYPHFEKAT